MTRGPRRVSTGDRLAYVDDCLTRADRALVEDRMLEDPELRKQIEGWLAQNEAIRTAFADQSAWSDATVGWGRPTRSRDCEPARQTPSVVSFGAALDDEQARGGDAHGLRLAPALRMAPARGAVARSPVAARLIQLVCAVGGAAAVWIGVAIVSADNGVAGFARATTAAYRTFAEGRSRPVEIVTADRAALVRWFATELGEAAPVPDLSAFGLSLVGGRIVPGASAPAAFALYEDPQRNRVALESEAADPSSATTPAFVERRGLASASWTRAGRGFTLVARAPRPRLEALARLVRDATPSE